MNGLAMRTALTPHIRLRSQAYLIKKQSPTSTAVFRVDVFVSASGGYRAGCGMPRGDWLSVAAFIAPPMIEPSL
jgi:hypothetical protein